MKFLLDENFPKSVKAILEDLNHDVLDIREINGEGTPDSEIMELAVKENAVVITTDRDFFHTLAATRESHPGIIVIALKQATRKKLHDKVLWLLKEIDPTQIPGRAFQLRDNSWRVYPPL